MTPLALKILYVEDHDEIREALASVLESEGFEVTAIVTAEEGLEKLKTEKFDLVLSDYSLPEHTGTWMLREARREGHLDGTPALLVTAHPNPDDADGVKVMRKPLDLDDFLREVHHLVAPARARMVQSTGSVMPRSGSSPMELSLYISAASPTSLRALRNLQRVLKSHRPEDVTLTVHDLSRETPATLEEDRIAFTPTLVRRSPAPRVWIVGALDDTSALEDMLEMMKAEKAS